MDSIGALILLKLATSAKIEINEHYAICVQEIGSMGSVIVYDYVKQLHSTIQYNVDDPTNLEIVYEGPLPEKPKYMTRVDDSEWTSAGSIRPFGPQGPSLTELFKSYVDDDHIRVFEERIYCLERIDSASSLAKYTHRPIPMDIITTENQLVVEIKQLGLLNDTSNDWMTLLAVDFVGSGSIDHPAAEATRIFLNLPD